MCNKKIIKYVYISPIHRFTIQHSPRRETNQFSLQPSPQIRGTKTTAKRWGKCGKEESTVDFVLPVKSYEQCITSPWFCMLFIYFVFAFLMSVISKSFFHLFVFLSSNLFPTWQTLPLLKKQDQQLSQKSGTEGMTLVTKLKACRQDSEDRNTWSLIPSHFSVPLIYLLLQLQLSAIH